MNFYEMNKNIDLELKKLEDDLAYELKDSYLAQFILENYEKITNVFFALFTDEIVEKTKEIIELNKKHNSKRWFTESKGRNMLQDMCNQRNPLVWSKMLSKFMNVSFEMIYDQLFQELCVENKGNLFYVNKPSKKFFDSLSIFFKLDLEKQYENLYNFAKVIENHYFIEKDVDAIRKENKNSRILASIGGKLVGVPFVGSMLGLFQDEGDETFKNSTRVLIKASNEIVDSLLTFIEESQKRYELIMRFLIVSTVIQYSKQLRLLGHEIKLINFKENRIELYDIDHYFKRVGESIYLSYDSTFEEPSGYTILLHDRVSSEPVVYAAFGFEEWSKELWQGFGDALYNMFREAQNNNKNAMSVFSKRPIFSVYNTFSYVNTQYHYEKGNWNMTPEEFKERQTEYKETHMQDIERILLIFKKYNPDSYNKFVSKYDIAVVTNWDCDKAKQGFNNTMEDLSQLIEKRLLDSKYVVGNR